MIRLFPGAMGLLVGTVLLAQEELPAPEVVADEAALTAKVGDEGGRIVLEARGVLPEVPVFFRADTEARVQIGMERIAYEIGMAVKVVQGKPKLLSLGLAGDGELKSVTGEGLLAWAVRRVGGQRFLDLEVDPENPLREFRFVATAELPKLELPAEIDLLHVRSGEAVGFSSTISVRVPGPVSARLVAAEGFLPLETGEDSLKRFQGTLGHRLAFALSRSSAVSAPAELTNAWLEGTVDEDTNSVAFRLRATAEVTKDEASLVLLRGPAAVSGVPREAGFDLALEAARGGRPVYRLHFPKAGTYPVEIGIVTRLQRSDDWSSVRFRLPSGAVVPVVMRGIGEDFEFQQDAGVVPSREGDAWRGFLPLDGRCAMAWKRVRKTGEGKLFFTTAAKVNVGVGAGLLRQTTIVDYKILQGKLEALVLNLEGPGEVLAVDGGNVFGWKVAENDGGRRLEVQLNQPIEGSSSLRIRSQLPLGAFPVRAAPLRILPEGAIRHAGYIRIYNLGATRLEVAGLEGLTQLSPEQFPETNVPGGDRQVFVYRFPSIAHACEVVADRVQPEVNVSQIAVYELSETDRVIRADVELDIREAPLREWDLMIPADYSVVAVSGAEVTDHHPGTKVEGGERSLKVTFGKEVGGRQLVRIHLEKNEPAKAGSWTLPRLRFPGAKSVRGEIGVASVPGYRIGVTKSAKLTEIPISRFQRARDDLQQTFRIREHDWRVTLKVESLPQSVQADVFHLYSLKDRAAYASVVLNYFITGAPVSEWKLKIPESAENVFVEGLNVRGRRTADGELTVSLHQPVVGPYTLLVTYEESVADQGGTILPGLVEPLGVRGERGFVQVVSSGQVDAAVQTATGLIKLDPLELPAEFQLLSAAPALATYQYTSRPFSFAMSVDWFDRGETVPQVVEFAEAVSRVSRDGEVVTETTMFVKSRGRRVMRVKLPTGSRPWNVQVRGRDVSAREDGEFILIPLPAGVDANEPVEVKLRIGKPADDGRHVVLTLPAVVAPVLKTQWRIEGDEGRVLVPRRSELPLGVPVRAENGLEWIANRAVWATAILLVLAAGGLWVRRVGGESRGISLAGILALVMALVLSLVLMKNAGENVRENVKALEFTLPVIAPGKAVSMVADNYSEWRARISLGGILAIALGVGMIGWSWVGRSHRMLGRIVGAFLLMVGILMQGGGAVSFFLLIAVSLFVLLVPWMTRWMREVFRDFGAHRAARRKAAAIRATERAKAGVKEKKKAKKGKKNKPGGGSDGSLPGPSTATVLAFGALLVLGSPDPAAASKEVPPPPPVVPVGLEAADRMAQEWDVVEGRLRASGTLEVRGKPGDTFLLLKAPAVLTKFEGSGLRVSKRHLEGAGFSYVVSIREGGEAGTTRRLRARFAFESKVGQNARRIAVPTGPAAVQEVKIRTDAEGWEFHSESAMQVIEEKGVKAGHSGATLVLAPRSEVLIALSPKARDVSSEKTQFFVEVANLFLPSPGVIDGRHFVRVRPSQGEVRELALAVPEGFTVSEVGAGPVGAWQFDAETRDLRVVITPAQSKPFSILVGTQGSLDPLPAETVLAPLGVADAVNEVGLVALAFGPEAQLEKAVPEGLSEVNLTDFDAGLIPEGRGGKPALRGVYRYGDGGGSLGLRVAPVAPELRVAAQQVVSIGDERLVVGVNFTVDIMRAGVFQMSFPLPAGLEVESLSGAALRHWTELTEGGERFVIMHLNGKTIGSQKFALSLTGPAPGPNPKGWLVPRFELREADRQTGELVMKPIKGTRLETINRRNVSEVDPRTVGGQGEGALAYRILQRDWELRLGIEKLEAWVTGQILHELTLREGQTRTAVAANLKVENASIRSLQVRLPGLSEEEAKTVRASGGGVSDIARVESADDLWTIQFKRRVIGGLNVRLEWERGGERVGGRETLRMVSFAQIRQTPPYYFVMRAGARLDLGNEGLPKGWQEIDWNAVPQVLREAQDRSIPALALRAVPPETSLDLVVSRHAVAEALKLRVAGGLFTTVVSPVGKLLTAVDLKIDVIQRSTLRVGLPADGVLYNVFVNGESVSIVREGQAYQFFVLPGPDDRTAEVQFVYSMPHQDLRDLALVTPELNVPLENIDWKVFVPEDFKLMKHGGSLDLRSERIVGDYDQERYLANAKRQRDFQAGQATEALDQANVLLSAGEQTKARQLLQSVAGNYGLDAASNEDARVQLRNLQEQQAIVGLNTRRQKLYLYNRVDDPSFQRNAQLEQAAADNKIINQGEVRFLPQEFSQFLDGNTKEDNANLRAIATRLVRHQRTTEPAPQAINVTLPDEGRVFTFSRSVQVNEGAPLELSLRFEGPRLRSSSREAVVLILVAGLGVAVVFGMNLRKV